MGARLTTITTRTGDSGMTGLVGGRRVSKDSPRIEALGTADELNSALGLACAFCRATSLRADLMRIQNDLCTLSAELATPPDRFVAGMPRIESAHVAGLERLFERHQARHGSLREFVLPGGSRAGAALHLARTVCRRAERLCVRLARQEKLGEFVVPYLNRLSDVLFVLAREANRRQRVKERPWKKPTAAPSRQGSRRNGR